MIGLPGRGILKHHFWGDYHASVAIEFQDEASAEQAVEVLGEGWRASGAVALWFGSSEALDACKAKLALHGLVVPPCGHSRCKSQCREQSIDGTPHSIDVGPWFEVVVEVAAAREQLRGGLRGGRSQIMIRYRIYQETPEGLWISDVFETKEQRHVVQNVIAGFLGKQPRWAVSEDTGEKLYGLDAKGKPSGGKFS